MRQVSILNTAVGTLNMGDEIIVDSVNRELEKIFRNRTMYINIPTHEKISRYSRRIINQSSLSFVAGTNLLTSKHNIIRGNQWNINVIDAKSFNNVILMGVGWTSYQGEPTNFTKLIYNNALTNKHFHSVRDSYTKQKLQSIGIENVYNTGCPTMWELTEEHCSSIPVSRAENVIFTITDYSKDYEKDKKMIDILKSNYKNVYCWIQGSGDYDYLRELTEDVIVIDPTLKSFDAILDENDDIEYIGTRLHAGIRSLQKKKRSLIIGIDNRASEKKKDFNINVLERNEIEQLQDLLNTEFATEIKLNTKEINMWRKQFA